MSRFQAIVVLLFLAVPVSGQTPSTDSQSLQALLAEVRQLRHDLQSNAIAAQRAQILVFRIERQETAVANASQKLDEARKTLGEIQRSLRQVTSNIKSNEDFVGRGEATPDERKRTEETLAVLRVSLSKLQAEEQQAQARELEVQEQVRDERAKLSDFDEKLDRIEKFLSDQQVAQNHNPN